MSTVLHINASATREGSVSRAITSNVIQGLQADRIIDRDLAAEPLPHVDDAWVKARLIAPNERTDAENRVLKQSDDLISEIQDADTVVFGLPVYNFGAPASMKAWMDLVARPGVTFRYTKSGPIGLLEGKKAIVVYASGGVPMGSEMDFATPHVRLFLKFIGITDVTFIDAKTYERAAAA